MRSLVVVAVSCVCSVVAASSAGANDIDLRIDNRAAPGQQPQLTIIVNKDVESVTVDLTSGSHHIKQKKGPQTQPGKIDFTLAHDGVGKLSWKGTLDVVFADGASGSMPLSFQTERLSTKFKFDVRRETFKEDLKENKVAIISERKTAKLEVEAFTDEDASMGTGVQEFSPPVAVGSVAEVSWFPRKSGDVLRLHATAYDENGSFQSGDWFPYTVTIPHEDVVFETGKSTIRAEQEPKLQAVLPEIEKAMKRFGPAMKAANETVKLLVQGHTDTVGDPASNRALSQSRAQAIAKWFKAHGVVLAVYARGVGEDDLAVETPDNTDEERNRRVEYNVGVNVPGGYSKVN